MTKRKLISLERKVYLSKAGQLTLESGGSSWSVCRTNNVQGNQLRRYIQSLPIMEEQLNGTTRSTAGLKTLSKGRVSSVKPIYQPLLECLLHVCHMGMPLSMNMVVVKGSQLLQEF